MTLNLNRNLNNNRFLLVYLKEVEVQDAVVNGVPLDVFQNGLLLYTIEVKVNNINLGSVNQLANVASLNSEVGSENSLTIAADFYNLLTLGESAVILAIFQFYHLATIEHARNHLVSAKRLCSLLAKVGSWLCIQFKSLHF